MFDSIIFRNQRKFDVERPLDISLLVEALIFYQSVTVIADKSILKQLIDQFGYDCLIELLENKFLNIIYLDNGLGIQTTNRDTNNERHSPIIYRLPKLSLYSAAHELFISAVGKTGKGRRVANRFMRSTDTISMQKELVEDIRVDFSDTDYVQKSVKHIINHLTPEYPDSKEIIFQPESDGKELLVHTNIDFDLLNRIYHSKIPASISSMSPALLLSHLFNVRSDIHFSSLYEAEIATDQISSLVLNFKYIELLERRKLSDDAIKLFQDFVFEDSKTVGSAFVNGNRKCSDLIKLLENSNKFKEWLKDKEPDAKLLKEYFKAVTAKSWVDKLPAKGTRWSIFTGIGLGVDMMGAGGLGTAAGMAVSATDSFLLDKFIKGWKPNQFIEKELTDFVKK